MTQQDNLPAQKPRQSSRTAGGTAFFSTLMTIGAGGFAGANARYLASLWIQHQAGTAFPYDTLLINVTGCYVLGVFSSLLQRTAVSDTWRLLVAIGFLGGYTTFSTFELNLYTLVQKGNFVPALLYLLLSMALGFLAVYLGVVTVRLFFAHSRQ